MKKKIIISLILGLLITIITSFIPFNSYDTEIGLYYSTGFPFKTSQMFGDAGITNNYAYLGNFIICSIIIFVIISVIAKIKNY